VIALGKASVLIEMVVNGSVDSNEFLQGSHAPEANHCTFSSSEWLIRILGLIVTPAARFLPIRVANNFYCNAVRSQFVGHQAMRVAMPFRRFPE